MKIHLQHEVGVLFELDGGLLLDVEIDERTGLRRRRGGAVTRATPRGKRARSKANGFRTYSKHHPGQGALIRLWDHEVRSVLRTLRARMYAACGISIEEAK